MSEKIILDRAVTLDHKKVKYKKHDYQFAPLYCAIYRYFVIQVNIFVYISKELVPI